MIDDAFAVMEKEKMWIATKDASGLSQSYYRIQRMFGGKRLASYVAVRVIEA